MTLCFNILISHHSSDNEIAKHLVDDLTKNGFNQVYLADETQPVNIENRYEYLSKSNVFIAVSSRNYLREEFCMEFINFARDLKKEIFAVNTQLSFRPYGALGAILAGSGRKLIEIENEETFQNDLNELISILNEMRQNTSPGEPILLRSIMPVVNLNFQTQILDILVSYHPSQKLNAELIGEGLRNGSFNYELEDSTKSTTSVKTCKTLVVVMSDEYEENYICKSVVNTARSLKKCIIPISVQRGWKSKHWLGLVVSGRLFFRFIDKEQVYKKIYDTAPINDFLYEVTKSLRVKPIQSDREKAFIKYAEKRIEECKQKLATWPPPHKIRQKKELKPVKVTLQEHKSDIDFVNVHYKVKQMEMVLPQQLYDNLGVPIREKFDVMISYQWGHQRLVRELFMDLHMKSLKVWFDIWGFMEGCTYDAMATAIECSKVMLIFLSKKYQESANCQLEFKYGVSRGKAFIFILIEDDIEIEPWLKHHFDESPKFEIKSLEDENILVNGMPRILLIAQAIREIGSAQVDADQDFYDLSSEAIKLKETLEDALDEIDRQQGSSRFRECTRCKKQFDEHNLIGCLKHRSYYVGGSIIAGRWVCCGQLEEDAIGCFSTNHIETPRNWTLNPNYGTYTWEPA